MLKLHFKFEMGVAGVGGGGAVYEDTFSSLSSWSHPQTCVKASGC